MKWFGFVVCNSRGRSLGNLSNINTESRHVNLNNQNSNNNSNNNIHHNTNYQQDDHCPPDEHDNGWSRHGAPMGTVWWHQLDWTNYGLSSSFL